jgi:dipeptidyl-peptidase-4
LAQLVLAPVAGSKRFYVVSSVDNTGTGYRGEEFKKKTYLQLGKF